MQSSVRRDGDHIPAVEFYTHLTQEGFDNFAFEKEVSFLWFFLECSTISNRTRRF